MAANITYHQDKWPFEDVVNECVFNSTEYIKSTIEEKSTLRRFSMLKDNKHIISLNYSLKNSEAIIGERASFGFPEIKNGTSFKRVQEFMDEFFKHLLKEKVQLIRWMHYPEIYDPQYNPIIIQSLLNLGFIIEDSHLNHHLNAESPFEKGLKNATQRRLNKINNSEIVLERHEEFDTSLFYDQFIDWRRQKNIPVNMTREVLDALINNTNTKYVLFTSKIEGKLIAMSIGARINENVLYYFIPASDPVYDDLSPAIGIIQKMHEYARATGIKYLDLGISTAKNQSENYGLIGFKEKLGSMSGIKYNFVKEIR